MLTILTLHYYFQIHFLLIEKKFAAKLCAVFRHSTLIPLMLTACLTASFPFVLV